MTQPIDGSGANPYPPSPAGWRPRALVQAEWTPLETALRARVSQTALARRVSMVDAAAIVLAELRAPVAPAPAPSDAPMREQFSPSRLPPETGWKHTEGKR